MRGIGFRSDNGYGYGESALWRRAPASPRWDKAGVAKRLFRLRLSGDFSGHFGGQRFLG